LEYLWQKNKTISKLFERLFKALQALNFEKEVYVNFDAVMHGGANEKTIMSVLCLGGLDDKWSYTTNVYLPSGSVVPNFSKSELCALCAETIFKIEEDYLNDEEFYYFP